MAIYKQNASLLEEAKQQDLKTFIAEHKKTEEDLDISTKEKEKAVYLQRIKQAVVFSTITGLVILLITVLVGGYLNSKREKALEYVHQAQACLDVKDYVCANDAAARAKKLGYAETLINPILVNISKESAANALENDLPDIALEQIETCLSLESANLECVQIICRSKILLAERFAGTAQWKNAVGLLDEVIMDCPNPHAAKEYQQQVFQRWYDDAVTRLNFLEANQAKKQWDARFPED